MPIGDLLAQITGEPSPTTAAHPINVFPKRKADEPLRRPVDKIQRTAPPAANISRPVNPSTNRSAVSPSMAAMRLSQNGNGRTPGSATSTMTATVKKPRPVPPPHISDALKPPPKKGSFAEIMARGQTQQAKNLQIGKIQHKRIEKLPNKRERDAMKTQKSQNLEKNMAPNSKFQKSDQAPLRDGRNGSRENKAKVAKEPTPEKKMKKAAAATTGYTGTARPRPGGSKALPRSSASGSSRRGRDEGKLSSARYAYVSEEDDEGAEEEDFYSDASSDMEAAVFEVDDEEEQASRIARKEDAEALAEENRLKREKEEKKRRLMAMAKKRR